MGEQTAAKAGTVSAAAEEKTSALAEVSESPEHLL
jgi:hypothetical protein